jgi:hypothetical protein
MNAVVCVRIFVHARMPANVFSSQIFASPMSIKYNKIACF